MPRGQPLNCAHSSLKIFSIFLLPLQANPYFSLLQKSFYDMALPHCRPNPQGRLQKWSQLSVAPAIHTVSIFTQWKVAELIVGQVLRPGLRKAYGLLMSLLPPWTTKGKYPGIICWMMRYHEEEIRGSSGDSSQPPNDPTAACRLMSEVSPTLSGASLRSAELAIWVHTKLLTYVAMH